jgi:hypothetical protein
MGHNMSMDVNNSEDFGAKFLAALKEKEAWLNSTLLPKIHDDYRLHLTCLNNLVEALSKKSLITPDPYQKDKKITQIQKPEESTFTDNERPVKLGLRICDYQSMIDYVCNYMKFTTDQLNLDKVQRLMDLNGTFQWSSLTANSPKMNTQALAICIGNLKAGAQQLQIAMINDSVNKSIEAMTEISNGLRQTADFIRERYKGEVYKNIVASDKFDVSKKVNPATFMAEIKRLFPSLMPKRPFSNDLIEEIIQEQIGDNKAAIQKKTLDKLRIEETKVVAKESGPNTHEVLMEAIRNLGTTSEQYEQVLMKIVSNNKVLQSGRNTFKDKVIRFIRKIFGLPEQQIDYSIVTTDTATHAKKHESLNYTEFVGNLAKRNKFYSGIAVKNSMAYNQISSQDEKKALAWLNKQMTENSRIQVVLAGLDAFFKSSVSVIDRPKIKGITMELTSLKNILVKTNQLRAEYVAYIEEKEQMRKLGITE